MEKVNAQLAHFNSYLERYDICILSFAETYHRTGRRDRPESGQEAGSDHKPNHRTKEAHKRRRQVRNGPQKLPAGLSAQGAGNYRGRQLPEQAYLRWCPGISGRAIIEDVQVQYLL